MQTADQFLRLVKIMDELREQCPWDRKQTIDTLRPLTLEETYELADAITDKDWKGIKEELADIMLHLLFYAKIGTEQNQFTLDEVISGVCEKLIFRHPHIYGDVKVADEEDVKKNWEKLKMKEGRTSVIEGVLKELPALLRAHRLQDKAAKVGFDWKNREDVWKKVEEETAELHHAIESKNSDHVEDEFGDLLFSLVNYARFVGVNPEVALRRTIDKFITRFNYIEAKFKEQGKEISNSTLEEMDVLWNEAKLL